MPVLISGVLKDGTGTPVQNCTIQLKACRTSTTVVVNTVVSENPDEAGRYSMDVEQGQYTVTQYALNVFHNMLPVKLWHTILTVTASFTIDIKRYSLPSGE